jgi:hypothetical protein
MLFPLLLVTVAQADECVRTYTLSELTRDVAGLEELLEGGDGAGFSSELARLEPLVPCLEAPLPPDAVARYRMFRGIGDYTQGLQDEAAAEFLGARGLSSDLALPVYGPQHKIQGLFRRFDPVRAQRVRLRAPRSGELLLDGIPTLERFVDAPVVAQIVSDGVVTDVQDLGAGELPVYPVRQPQRVPLVVTTSALAVTAAVLLAQVPIAQKGFSDTTDVNALNRYRTRNNQGLVWGTTTGILAVGSGVATGVWWTR